MASEIRFLRSIGQICFSVLLAAAASNRAAAQQSRGCRSGLDCVDGNVCTNDACRERVCVWEPAPDGSRCEPGGNNPCVQGRCKQGQCQEQDRSGWSCPDEGDACTDDRCVGKVCRHQPDPRRFGKPCTGDGNACTSDICDDKGKCSHPPAAIATACEDDGNTCTGDLCDGNGACAHPALADGTPCDDGDPQTHDDQCRRGFCSGVVEG